MSREIRSKGMESRERLLNVAAEEFAHRGYHETKISTIVAQAGLTQPAFYLYFQSKEAIFSELINKFRSRLHELIESSRLNAPFDAEDVQQRILQIVVGVFRFLAASPNLTRIGLLLAAEADQIKSELVVLVANNLREEQKLGCFRSELEMETVAECVVGIIERLTFSQLLPGRKEPESLASEIVNLLLHGMLKNKTASTSI